MIFHLWSFGWQKGILVEGFSRITEFIQDRKTSLLLLCVILLFLLQFAIVILAGSYCLCALNIKLPSSLTCVFTFWFAVHGCECYCSCWSQHEFVSLLKKTGSCASRELPWSVKQCHSHCCCKCVWKDLWVEAPKVHLFSYNIIIFL